MEPLARYRERLLQVRREFELHPDQVIIRARWLLRGKHTSTLRLQRLESKPRPFFIRYRLFKHAVAVAALMAGLAVVLARPGYESWGPRIVPIAWGLSAAGALLALASWKKVKFVRFNLKDQPRRSGLDIACAGPDADQFDGFIERLRQAINRQ